MQEEIDGVGSPIPVRILAIDGAEGALSSSYGMQGISLPLLQDTPEGTVLAGWNARQHDVVILGVGNEAMGLFSLSTHDLGLLADYEEFLEYLRLAADG